MVWFPQPHIPPLCGGASVQTRTQVWTDTLTLTKRKSTLRLFVQRVCSTWVRLQHTFTKRASRGNGLRNSSGPRPCGRALYLLLPIVTKKYKSWTGFFLVRFENINVHWSVTIFRIIYLFFEVLIINKNEDTSSIFLYRSIRNKITIKVIIYTKNQ